VRPRVPNWRPPGHPAVPALTETRPAREDRRAARPAVPAGPRRSCRWPASRGLGCWSAGGRVRWRSGVVGPGVEPADSVDSDRGVIVVLVAGWCRGPGVLGPSPGPGTAPPDEYDRHHYDGKHDQCLADRVRLAEPRAWRHGHGHDQLRARGYPQKACCRAAETPATRHRLRSRGPGSGNVRRVSGLASRGQGRIPPGGTETP
jgi:hypothetical protein